MNFGRAVVKFRIPILILAFLAMIPCFIGMIKTRINYDMLDYLPEDIDTVTGQHELRKDFGKGAFSFIIVEDMVPSDVAALKSRLESVSHVDTVLWYNSFMNLSVPIEMLPDELYDAFNTDNSTMLAVFFDTSTSEDATIQAIKEIRKTCNKQCFVSGMSALVTDLKDLCEKEEPTYVGLAILCACAAMIIFLDGWLVPFVFLASMGISIMFNMGSNYFFGEISYITKAMAAVLQLAVTLDYSIFLWHSYNEQLAYTDDKNEAMGKAINATMSSVVGSSITTVAGFAALCFMSFTMGRDLGLVMAKGVILGVIGSVTHLPALILLLNKPLQRTKHKPLIPNLHKFSTFVTKKFPLFLVIFIIIAIPAAYGYQKTNSEIYYDMGKCLPREIDYIKANEKLINEYDVASTHMVLIDSSLPASSVRSMLKEMQQVDGVKFVLGLENIVGPNIPEELIPQKFISTLKSERWELILITSNYFPATDKVNSQIDELNIILKRYDPAGMLIGEAPCTKDLIETTGRDFKVVTFASVFAIFIIIAIVERSWSLPFILIAVIEFAIFINLGIPHFAGQSLPFIAPICISTIQLGATVDYAILMTTRYKEERRTKGKSDAVIIALETSMPSIIVSGMGLFAATFGVAVYSEMDIISSMCMLMARGALVSAASVILILPAFLMLLDRIIIGRRQTKLLKKSLPIAGRVNNE